ncbi:glycoside hydrolase [Aquimarina sp. MMG016]|uniref:glycoside hydrolase n=1 Tax=Aquimarina sp. MMG016 TaxID=2822690 RepID=UPI001B3A2022|nr:glycoside hydrolase [Aquimarina sp. MMG016]MBQ4820603.1 glycosyl hydrolase [Aquimarina sp. MMG016]
MKKITLSIVLFYSAMTIAQFNPNAPWMQGIQQKKSAGKTTFSEIQQAFDTYWKTHDKDAKGSGYKPFKRWEQLWGRQVKADGSLPTGKDMWEAWEAHQRFGASAKSAKMADLSNWQPMGPYNHVQANAQPSGQGRLNAITVDPNNSSIWYVGSPNGGLWKTINAGSNWTPMTDNLPRLGVSAIAVDHNNSNIVYIATGDDDADQTPTIGVMKSLDGGVTWNQTGLNVNTLGNITQLHELFIDPNNSNKLVCATSDGVFTSSDAGATWSQTLNGNNIKDLRLKPGDASVVYAVSLTAFFRSADGGGSFTQVTNGVPTNTFRMVIDVTPANPNYVYIFSSDGADNRQHGIYRSTDSGQSFTTREVDSYTLIGNGQVWYNMAMGVSDTNADEIYVGVMDVWKSTNGGQSWTKLNRWDRLTEAYTHADIHSIRVANGKVFVASDGGIYSSEDNGVNFTPHYQDLQIGEFFNVAVAKGNPDNIAGGLQDNGGFGVGVNGEYRAYHPGDGVNSLITPADDNTYYGFIQNGGRLYISNRADGFDTWISKPGGAGNGVWVTPLSADSNGEVYAAWDNLFKLNRTNESWEQVGAWNGYTNVLEIAPSDPNRIVSSSHQNLRVSSDGGQTLDFNTNVVGNSITSIEIHQDNADIMWITTDGDYANKGIFKTTDGGYNWTNITGNFPVATEYPAEIVHQGNHPLNPIYVSTDLGVYRLDDSSPDWEPFMTGLPNTKIEDLEINLTNNTLTAGTYGRGIWRTSIPVQLLNDDVAITAITSPNNSSRGCGSVVPQIRVRSNGENEITTIDITYTIDSGTANNYTWNGSLLSNQEIAIDLPEITPSGGAHTITITVNIPNDENAQNNQSATSFTMNAPGEVNTINTFENQSDELVVENNVWERGIPNGGTLNTVSSDTQAYGTNLGGNYPENSNAFLVTPCFDFTTIQNPVLKFQMAYDLERNWDWANVEYSLNGGQSWETLGSVNSQPNWYNSSRTEGSDCFGCPGAQWTGTNATMTEYGYDFAANALLGETDLTTADNILFRIGLHSDAVINQEGLVIDDLVMEGIQTSSKINPIVFLQGAATNPNVGEESLMRDDLRVASTIPITSPYTDAATTSATVFNTTGTNAVVDWVWVELRQASDATLVVDGKSGLLQRNGTIVDSNGTDPISFNVPYGNYFVAVTHRNHLGIVSATTYGLTSTPADVDLSSADSVVLGGTNAVILLANGKYAMISGDHDNNGQVQNSDINAVIQLLGNSGYQNADMDMNGQIQNTDINNMMNPNLGKGEQY